MKTLIVTFLAFFLCVGANAKVGKVKYGKYIVYEGEVMKKVPSGHGVLTFKNMFYKKEVDLVVEGDFNGNEVTDPTFTTQLTYDMKVSGSVPITFMGDKGKALAAYFDLKDTKVDIGEFPDFPQAAVLGEPVMKVNSSIVGWEINVATEGVGNNVMAALVNTGNSVPQLLKDLGFTTTHGHARFFMNKRGMKIDKYFIDNLFHCWYDGEKFCQCEYSENSIHTNGRYTTFTSNGKSWSGRIALSDDSWISTQSGSRFKVHYPNGNEFSGSIKEDGIRLIAPDFNMDEIHYVKGELTKNGTVEKWIFGEPYDTVRERLLTKLDEDLVQQVLDEDITESEADKQQEIRDEEKRKAEEEAQRQAEEEQRKAEAAAYMQQRWHCTDIMFCGTIKGSKDTNVALKSALGLDSSYFTGEATLALESSGEGAFTFVATPSAVANKGSEERALKVANFCETINKNLKGAWKIEDNKLYIDGEDTGVKFNKDGTVATYVGLLLSDMKIKSKQ